MTKRSIPGGVLTLWMLLAACAPEPSGFTASDGQAMRLDGSDPGWVLVNYWAEWCTPCRKEIPDLNALHASGKIRVVGVNADPRDDALVVARMGIGFPQLAADPGPALGWERPRGLPASVVIAPGRGVVTVRFGPQTQDDILRIMSASSLTPAN